MKFYECFLLGKAAGRFGTFAQVSPLALFVLAAPNGVKFQMEVDNNGALTTEAI